MINCAKCGKENQDHYKFCLGCGAELTKTSGPKPFSADTPPHGVPAARAAAVPRPEAGRSFGPSGSMGATAVASANTTVAPAAPGAASPAQPAAAPVQSAPVGASQVATAEPPPVQLAPGTAAATPAGECPQCGHVNSASNRFCASCGFNLGALARSNPPPGAASPSGAPGARALRLTALRADGSEAGTFDVPNEPRFFVGRDTGSIFAGDSYLSPKHASFGRHGGEIHVRDEGSLNGVYLKIRPQVPWALNFGDIFRIGQEIIRVEALESNGPSPDGVERLGSPRDGYVGRLALVIGRDTTGNAFPIPRGGVHCGRERGDILFSEDGYVSGLHCRVAPAEDGRLYLTDVGSSNGTFVRLGSEYRLAPGDILLMGQQLFRADIT